MNCDTTGVSYENPPTFDLVPTDADTVIKAGRAETAPVLYWPALHLSWVLVVHDVVAHSLSKSDAVGEAMSAAKLRPTNVSVLPPDITLLVPVRWDDTGES
jgi:hypothetical protein